MMMNFEEVVHHYWRKALRTIKEDPKELEHDREAIKAVTDTNTERSTRQKDLRAWFHYYRVFQGLTRAQRDEITEAVLVWSDARDPRRDLTTPEALAEAHAELMKVVCQAYGKNRDFTSLASKALWLCYPHSVPIYDRNVRNTLHIIGKIEDGITTISEKSPEYAQFVHVWKQLYARHEGTIENLDVGTYPYRVRVFDRVLLLIGQPTYRVG